MKRIFLIFILALSMLSSMAQKQKLPNNPNYEKRLFHLGFVLGLNTMNCRVNNSLSMYNVNDTIFAVEPSSQMGFHIAMITDLKLGEHFNLRFLPGLMLGGKDIEYKLRQSSSRHEYVFAYETSPISSIYVNFPLMMKFKAQRINNYRPYLLVGGSVMFDLESHRSPDDDDVYFIERNPFELGVEVGVGIDWFMPFFKLGTEFKAHFGFTDVMKHNEPWEHNSSIDGLFTNIFMLSFNFE